MRRIDWRWSRSEHLYLCRHRRSACCAIAWSFLLWRWQSLIDPHVSVEELRCTQVWISRLHQLGSTRGLWHSECVMLRLILISARLLCHPFVDASVHQGVCKGVCALWCLRCLKFWGGVSRECLDSPHLSTWRCRSPLALSETAIARLRRVWHHEIAVCVSARLDRPPGPPVPNTRLILHRGGRLRGQAGGCSPYKQIAAGRSP